MSCVNSARLRVLVVEDEGLVSMLIEDMLTDMGHEVSAVAARMVDALKAARTDLFDIAIIDVNLDGQPSYPIADLLKARGIPFVYATGYGGKGLDAKYAGTPTLAKPFAQSDLKVALLHALRVALPRHG
jgi:CheY-like chemotaxis protein